MEIVVITGVLAVAALMLLTLRMRALRGSARKARSARQWSGSAVAYVSAGGSGVAVQDPPRTGEADLDDWDDDLGWSDDLNAHDEPAPAAPAAPVAFDRAPAPAPAGYD